MSVRVVSWTAIAVALVAASAVYLKPVRAGACSCFPAQGAGHVYLDPDGVVPRDSRGIAWSAAGVVTDRARLERWRRGAWSPVSVRVEPLFTGESAPHQFQLWLIVPKRGFREGARYRLTVTEDKMSADFRRQDPKSFGADDPKAVQREFTVGPRWPKVDGPVTLSVTEVRTVDALQVRAGGACSFPYFASVVDVDVELPDVLEPFAAQIVVDATVDGGAWRPTDSVCSRYVRGRPWTKEGNGRVVYSACVDATKTRYPSMEMDTLMAWSVGRPPGTARVGASVFVPALGKTLPTEAVERVFSCDEADSQARAEAATKEAAAMAAAAEAAAAEAEKEAAEAEANASPPPEPAPSEPTVRGCSVGAGAGPRGGGESFLALLLLWFRRRVC